MLLPVPQTTTPLLDPRCKPQARCQLPTDEWPCRNLAKMNLTLTDGYPCRGAEAGGLQRDQFLKPPRSQAKWYGCHSQQKSDNTETVNVVSYINKEGGMRSGPLCALLWRILTWCTRKQVTLKA